MENKPKYVKGVSIKEFQTKYGIGISFKIYNEDDFFAFFLANKGVYSGGMEFLMFKQLNDKTKYSIMLNEKAAGNAPKVEIERDFSSKSEDHTMNAEKDEDLPF
jgi:hypothetical protein